MKPNVLVRSAFAGAVAMALALGGCKDNITNESPAGLQAGTPSAASVSQSLDFGRFHFGGATQVNLVADNASFPGARVDPNLLNAWGIAVTPTGIFWLSANGAGLSTVYGSDGTQKRPPVAIPTPDSAAGGAVAGALFNSTTDFVIKGTNASAKFIFSTEDGTIAAWNAGNSAMIVADRSGSNAIYKGIAMGGTASHPFLCATDFHNGKVDVFDGNFKFVTDRMFQDRGIPKGFAPFGIRNFGRFIIVTYAKQKLPVKKDDEAGPGFGYVDVFSQAGKLVRRLASRGTLNSPWGLEMSQEGESHEGESREGVLYVGNFGDGKVSRFSMDGKFLGLLNDPKGKPVVIDGLWGLSFDNLAADQNKLFFTAGPNEESDGLFGYLSLNSTQSK